ncbi:MAG: AbrB/MazE/SpoVT family DNA-binding domain-containing protein [Bacillus sp. (in: firmicutes)]
MNKEYVLSLHAYSLTTSIFLSFPTIIYLRERKKIMKSTGIVRKTDRLGRIVVPKELRKTLNINYDDPLEIFTDEDKIILQKYKREAHCIITGELVDKPLALADGKVEVSEKGLQLLYDELVHIIDQK